MGVKYVYGNLLTIKDVDAIICLISDQLEYSIK